MKKLLTILHLSTTLAIANESSKVYVCNNGNTSVYHTNRNCGALNRCTHEINIMSSDEAQK